MKNLKEKSELEEFFNDDCGKAQKEILEKIESLNIINGYLLILKTDYDKDDKYEKYKTITNFDNEQIAFNIAKIFTDSPEILSMVSAILINKNKFFTEEEEYTPDDELCKKVIF